MAQQRIIRYVDDIDGSEAKHSVEFSIGRTPYEIDLSEENKRKFDEAMKPFIDAARKAGSVAQIRTTKQPAKRSDYDREQAVAVRQWAKANGYEVSERGRIPSVVVEAYANRDQGDSLSIPVTLPNAGHPVDIPVTDTQPSDPSGDEPPAKPTAKELRAEATKILREDRRNKGKSKPAKRDESADTDTDHPYDECEDLDNCPIHATLATPAPAPVSDKPGKVIEFSNGKRGRNLRPSDDQVMAWIKANSGARKVTRTKPTAADYKRYADAHPNEADTMQA